MNANAIVGVVLDYEVFGQGRMMVVSVSGTAVLMEGGLPTSAPLI